MAWVARSSSGGKKKQHAPPRFAHCIALPKCRRRRRHRLLYQVCIMIHSGSRGLGHQATDALVEMEKAMARDGIHTNDRQLACARINSKVRPFIFSWVAGSWRSLLVLTCS